MLLILMLLTLVLLATISQRSGGELASNADNALLQSRRTLNRATSQQLADTGVRMTVQWLNQQTTALPTNRAFAPSQQSTFFGATTEAGFSVLILDQTPPTTEMAGVPPVRGTVRVRILPAFDNARLRQLWLIESVGEYGQQRSFNRALVRPKSFAYYGIVYDEPITVNWVAGLTSLSGPVHLNMRLAGTQSVDPAARQNIYWNDTNPIFLSPQPDYFTISGTSDQLLWRRAGGALQRPTEADWPSIAEAGVEPTYSTPLLTLPTTAVSTHDAALGGAAAPVAPSVLIPDDGASTTGGIYVQGSVKKLTLGTGGTGDTQQLVTVEQRVGTEEVRTVITLDRLANQTTWQRLTAPVGTTTYTLKEQKVLTGITNGTIYVEGDINGLSGTIANSVMSGGNVARQSALTLATPSDRTVQVNGGVVYKNLVTGGDSTNPTSTAIAGLPASGSFGLVVGSLIYPEQDGAGRPLTQIGLHGAVLAMGETRAVAYNTRPAGDFHFLGSYIVRKQGAMGTFSTTLMTQTTGFHTTRTYDPRLAEAPPPTFPDTNDYKILSYQADVSPLP